MVDIWRRRKIFCALVILPQPFLLTIPKPELYLVACRWSRTDNSRPTRSKCDNASHCEVNVDRTFSTTAFILPRTLKGMRMVPGVYLLCGRQTRYGDALDIQTSMPNWPCLHISSTRMTKAVVDELPFLFFPLQLAVEQSVSGNLSTVSSWTGGGA